MNAFNSLLEKIENSTTLDFGDIFSESIELFKKVWVQGLVMLLLMMVILIPFYLMMYLPLTGMGILDSYQDTSDINPILMIPFFIFIFIFSIVAMVISFGMKASFYRICKHKDLNIAGSDDYFYFLKKPYLGKVIALSLMTFGISLVSMLLCVLPLIYAIVPITLVNVIFAFNPDMSASEIIKAGFKLGHKKWLLTFGLIVVSGILAELVGMLMCFVGIFVTVSFAYIPVYFVYKGAVGFNDSVEVDNVPN
ncbi:hypothetical protein [Xanthomarina sp. F2636L]|uniref:hypothetical protein n=1 Tax=Xanthomarina sp. F2636L TaxID=2996018 RepID=UPI00225DFB0F|nr:hypothetical protein [Xanthomarina sp. F2636L]MCX7551829.1 hypothetical protein [Xanthomarina sp. F2636L]